MYGCAISYKQLHSYNLKSIFHFNMNIFMCQLFRSSKLMLYINSILPLHNKLLTEKLVQYPGQEKCRHTIDHAGKQYVNVHVNTPKQHCRGKIRVPKSYPICSNIMSFNKSQCCHPFHFCLLQHLSLFTIKSFYPKHKRLATHCSSSLYQEMRV